MTAEKEITLKVLYIYLAMSSLGLPSLHPLVQAQREPEIQSYVPGVNKTNIATRESFCFWSKKQEKKFLQVIEHGGELPCIFFIEQLHSHSPWPLGNLITEAEARHASETHRKENLSLLPDELWSQKCRQSPIAFFSLFPLPAWSQKQAQLWEMCGRAEKQKP